MKHFERSSAYGGSAASPAELEPASPDLQAPPDVPPGPANDRARSLVRDVETLAKTAVKSAFRSVGLHLFRTLPRGVSVSHDLRRALPGHRFALIFDVGANIGQSVKSYLKELAPDLVVCFEPSRTHFAELVRVYGRDPKVRCERLALGSAEGGGTLVQTVDPTMYHLTGIGPEKDEVVPTIGAEAVTVTTVDRYCAQRRIEFVDFLKVDTEGHDYEVVVGADDLLSDERVGALQVECSVSPENTFHVGFDTMRAHFEMKGYRLFGIYEQVHEWMARTPNLRRVNAVFVSRRFMRSA